MLRFSLVVLAALGAGVLFIPAWAQDSGDFSTAPRQLEDHSEEMPDVSIDVPAPPPVTHVPIPVGDDLPKDEFCQQDSGNEICTVLPEPGRLYCEEYPDAASCDEDNFAWACETAPDDPECAGLPGTGVEDVAGDLPEENEQGTEAADDASLPDGACTTPRRLQIANEHAGVSEALNAVSGHIASLTERLMAFTEERAQAQAAVDQTQAQIARLGAEEESLRDTPAVDAGETLEENAVRTTAQFENNAEYVSHLRHLDTLLRRRNFLDNTIRQRTSERDAFRRQADWYRTQLAVLEAEAQGIDSNCN